MFRPHQPKPPTPTLPGLEPRDLWDDLLPQVPHHKPPGSHTMLYLIAYDIADERRLVRIANVCEDFGVRVQYSLFECWLEEEAFSRFWQRLNDAIVPTEDRLAAYTLDAAAVHLRRKAGQTMAFTEKVNCYIV